MTNLTRAAAAEYLRKYLGRSMKAQALSKLAHEGRGPPYRVVLKRALYEPSALDAWVAEIASEASIDETALAQRREARAKAKAGKADAGRVSS